VTTTEARTTIARPYIDVHAHVGETINRVPPMVQTIEKYLGRMADSSVYAAIPFPAAGFSLARGVQDLRAQHENIARACRDYPERFPVGLGISEVRLQRAGVDELERAMRDDGLLGFMVHSGISGHQLGDVLHPLLEVVDARGGIAMIHVGERGPAAAAAAYARRFKNTTFLMAHVSTNERLFAAAAEHLATPENVWVDFAQHPQGGAFGVERVVNAFPTDRLLFGSDIPYYDYRILQRQVEAAPISEEMKDRIAYRNAVALIQRFKPEWRLPESPTEMPAAFAGQDLWGQQPGKPGRLY
jgi:predicted TIM-barrel fold metal-dependent hydrolase